MPHPHTQDVGDILDDVSNDIASEHDVSEPGDLLLVSGPPPISVSPPP